MKAIKQKDLLANTHYSGVGRNGYVGFWDGKQFHVFGISYNQVKHKVEDYYSPLGGSFIPFRMVRKLNNYKAIQKVKLPRDLDRRVKLTEETRAAIRTFYREGYSIRAIARALSGKCSRRMIQFILFPDRMDHAKLLYKERRKDGRYYDRQQHAKAIKSTRSHKIKNLLWAKP